MSPDIALAVGLLLGLVVGLVWQAVAPILPGRWRRQSGRRWTR